MLRDQARLEDGGAEGVYRAGALPPTIQACSRRGSMLRPLRLRAARWTPPWSVPEPGAVGRQRRRRRRRRELARGAGRARDAAPGQDHVGHASDRSTRVPACYCVTCAYGRIPRADWPARPGGRRMARGARLGRAAEGEGTLAYHYAEARPGHRRRRGHGRGRRRSATLAASMRAVGLDLLARWYARRASTDGRRRHERPALVQPGPRPSLQGGSTRTEDDLAPRSNCRLEDEVGAGRRYSSRSRACSDRVRGRCWSMRRRGCSRHPPGRLWPTPPPAWPHPCGSSATCGLATWSRAGLTCSKDGAARQEVHALQYRGAMREAGRRGWARGRRLRLRGGDGPSSRRRRSRTTATRVEL